MSVPVHTQTDSYWLGYGWSTVVTAIQHPDDPRRLLEARLDEFLRSRPAEDPLAAKLREHLLGGKNR